VKLHLKELAGKKDISMYQISKRLDLSYTTVYNWACGHHLPSNKNLTRLCGVLNCEVGELLTTE